MLSGIFSNRDGGSSVLNLFAPPVLADQQGSARARILYIAICGTMFVTAGIALLITVLQLGPTWRGIDTAVFVFSLGLVLLQINRQGRTKLAAMLFAGGLIACMTALAVTAGGVRSPGVTMYFIIVLMAGLLLGERAGTITALVCAALGFGLLMADRAGLLPPGVRYNSETIWLLSCLYLGVTVVLLRLPTLLIRTAVAHAESELSERKRAEALLVEKQRLLETMIENTPAAVAMFDTDMRYIAYNERWLTDHRLGGRDLKGISHYDVLPDISEDWKAEHRRCLAGARETRERDAYIQPDGTEDVVRWIVQPWVKGGGDVGGVTIFFEVITARIRAEEERRLLMDQLLEAHKFEALGTLAGGIAHDINNILAMIGTNAELGLSEGEKEDSARTSFKEIVGATARAKDIVRQILLFSRKQATPFETIELAPIVDDAMAFLRATVPPNVEIRKIVEPGLPPIRASASQIYQVLMNLGTNAAHAMPAGGVLSVGLATINIPNAETALPGDLQAGKYVQLSVRDTGTGMNEKTLSRIFEPFFTTRGIEGTGLGMSVVHGLVKAHGGAIRVESELGKGSAVHVYFPATAAGIADAPPVRGESVHGRGQRIMYIDDEVTLGHAMTRVLRLLGYQCKFYSDPRIALDVFRGDPDQFDAVISDMTMPDLSGLDIAREFLAIRRDVPIALTSGRVDHGTESFADFEGIKAWLTKPATIEEIDGALAILLPKA